MQLLLRASVRVELFVGLSHVLQQRCRRKLLAVLVGVALHQLCKLGTAYFVNIAEGTTNEGRKGLLRHLLELLGHVLLVLDLGCSISRTVCVHRRTGLLGGCRVGYLS